MDQNTKTLLTYLGFWIYLVLIVIFSYYLYERIPDVIKIVVPLFSELVFPSSTLNEFSFEFKIPPTSESLVFIAYGLIGILWIWRWVKVLVIMGSPFTIGRTQTITSSSSNKKVLCRIVGNIEPANEVEGEKTLWFYAILREHPNSSKLMRYRLSHMMVSIPRSTLIFEESRFYLRSNTHKSRISRFNRLQDEYRKDSKSMFQIQKQLEQININLKKIQKESNEIDDDIPF